MIDFKNVSLNSELIDENLNPTIEININVAELRKQHSVTSNEELFLQLSTKGDTLFIINIFDSLHKQITEYENSDSEEIRNLIQELKVTNKITYQEWPCGSCGDTGGGVRWKRVCQNGHCYCPRC